MVPTPTVFFCDLRCTSDRCTEQRIGQSTSIVAAGDDRVGVGRAPEDIVRQEIRTPSVIRPNERIFSSTGYLQRCRYGKTLHRCDSWGIEMAVPLPYLVSYKNAPTLFEKIASAKIPETFNREFLQTTIGLKGSNDRALIPFLRNLGFIEQSGIPTQSYRLLKGEKRRVALEADRKIS
jgi:Family of unknown function (DUF5343)